MIFGFDLDGVIYPWHKYAWEWYVKRTGNEISFNDFWKYPDGFVPSNDTSDIVKEMVDESETYWMHPVSPFVSHAVQKIGVMADSVWYITSRPTWVKEKTAEWLQTQGFPFSNQLLFADEYGGKYRAVMGAKCDYYAEDRPKYLEVLPEITNVFIITTPYNTYKEFDGVRVNHVMEIPSILERDNGFQRISKNSTRNSNI